MIKYKKQVRLTRVQNEGLALLARARGESQETVLRDLLVRELLANGLYPTTAAEVLEEMEVEG